MKRLIYALTVLAPLASAVHADDANVKNYALALVYGYDRECETIPNPAARRRFFTALEANSGAELDAALGLTGAMIRREGSTAFCAKFKDFMAEAFKQ